MRWVDRSLYCTTLALSAALATGCANSGGASKDAAAAKPVSAAATVAAPPPQTATLEGLPPDSLVIVVTGKNAYSVQDATATCEGLAGLLMPYRQTNLVVTGAQDVTTTIADVLCVATVARQRGGKAYMTHPDGLRSIDIQN
ncbi:hypothetical protein [Tahibacter sp.]|uniref:hypothetical protein n=1 Tax=Tahibacter sp. TaxID=2056211 RepID=UPI0028C50E6F|nr:hypothetical protein [Tahibacter sp.]